MKINKIQCDICEKLVDYNDERIRDTIFESTSPSISRNYYEKFKANHFVLLGITKMKNINKIDTSELDVTINIENDLCEDCLVELRKMINKWKEERKNEFSS